MPKYLAALVMVLVVGMVVTRVLLMKRRGIKAMHFGNIDKKDFLIPPFAFFYIYIVFANAFHWRGSGSQHFFRCAIINWFGVALCFAGLSVLLCSLISFGRSFRVGIDIKHPDKLITTGVFAFSRNPIYVAFVSILTGQFLIFSHWIFLVYLAAGVCLIHRQVLREEDYLKKHYGQEFLEYCNRVRRYF